jgi:hypothetical protein
MLDSLSLLKADSRCELPKQSQSKANATIDSPQVASNSPLPNPTHLLWILIVQEAVMDENYQTYLNRAMRMALPETHQAQVQHIQESPKFRRSAQGFEPTPFFGYTVITPPGPEDELNGDLYRQVAAYRELARTILGPDQFVPIPWASFHLTLADVIWHSAYDHAVGANPNFEGDLRSCLGRIFQKYAPLTEGSKIRFQPLGLIVMTRALALALVPAESQSYDRVVEFRRRIYQDSQLMGLGIEQQYHFTPHLTLGYFGALPPMEERRELATSLQTLADGWQPDSSPSFLVNQAQLRKFDNMTHYYREADWPLLEF